MTPVAIVGIGESRVGRLRGLSALRLGDFRERPYYVRVGMRR